MTGQFNRLRFERIARHGLGAVLALLVVDAPHVAAAPADAPMFSAATLAACARLRDAALHDDYAYARDADLADLIGPRPAGSRAAEAAVGLVADRLRELGLTVRLEPALVSHWVRGEEHAEVTAYPGQRDGLVQHLALLGLGHSGATPAGGIDAPVVVVRDFGELVRLGRGGVAGKIVVFDEKFDKTLATLDAADLAYEDAVGYRGRGPRMAAQLGAVAAFVRSVGSADFRLPSTGATNFGDTPPIPAAALAAEDVDRIARLADRGEVRVHLVLDDHTLPPAASHNVIAQIPGSEDPQQVVVLGGHLDAWDPGNGAIDDGAGVAIGMQVLHLVKTLGLRPKRTLRFVAFMDEELGGGGGRAYGRDEAGNISDHVAALEADAGSDRAIGIRIDAPKAGVDALAPLLAVLQPIGSGHAQRVDGSPEADIGPIVRAGVPGIGLWQDNRTYFDYHHTAADTLDKVDPQTLAQSAATFATIAYGLADADGALPRPAVQP